MCARDEGGGMWDVGCGMWDVGCGTWDVGCGMWDVECGMRDDELKTHPDYRIGESWVGITGFKNYIWGFS